MITGAQIRAARLLLQWGPQDLADHAKLGVATVRRSEATDGEPRVTMGHAIAIRYTLERAGVIFFVEENGAEAEEMKGPESITAMRDRLVAEKMAARDRANRQRSDDVLAGEHARQEATTARIVKLRALRETRDAVEQEVAEAEAKRVASTKRKGQPEAG